jgi:hypothetical protein
MMVGADGAARNDGGGSGAVLPHEVVAARVTWPGQNGFNGTKVFCFFSSEKKTFFLFSVGRGGPKPTLRIPYTNPR